MIITKQLSMPGEHRWVTTGRVGQLEAILTVPDKARTDIVAFLGHPHSLQGGTMNNKVVTTMARAFKALSIPSVRFNFRGVGESEGEYDAGIGESEDMLALVEQWKSAMPAAQFIFAGFSFGSYVVYRVAAQHEHLLLITIAPPVHHYDYMQFNPSPSPWFIIQGEDDEVVPLNLVEDFASQMTPALSMTRFADTGHFFHGKLIELKSCIMDALRSRI